MNSVNYFVLTRAVKYFKMLCDVLVLFLGKSTYARCGIIVNARPIDPGWEEHVTPESSSITPLSAKIYASIEYCKSDIFFSLMKYTFFPMRIEMLSIKTSKTLFTHLVVIISNILLLNFSG
jgi:hypothetical protein